MNELKSRNQNLDIAKGIGIILVVLAHNSTLGHYHIISSLIMPFHMPLFFFISGVLIKEGDTLKTTLQKKYHSLIVPYLFSVTLVIILKFIIQNHIDMSLTIKNFIFVFYSTGKTLVWPHLWFLPSLFTTVIFFKITDQYLFYRISNPLIKLLIVLLFITTGYAFINGSLQTPQYRSLLINYGGMPWSIDLLGITFCYTYFGFILKRQAISDKNNIIFNKYLTLIYMLFYIILSLSSKHIDLNLRQLNNIAVDTVKTILGIFTVIGISNAIANSNLMMLKKSLSHIGQISLIIYIFHYYIQIKVSEIIISHSMLPESVSSFISFGIGLLSPVAIAYFVIRKYALLRKVYCNS